ncbi:monofunctional biosynthetic peptidoglycan transglycosylase [Cyanobacterium stanieri LEGE 03274]|uniref:Biosynthetic peptidoglycan transglycosylase n=1 Tax=Cyanobacterium stanieri LEGE 03274 TaxID=1828756 RepID=A0ABR9V463_9CHRO|nr:monofunctional biosynthetic peptidoglycan transglycosylase [Cyanobacterium stanieri]MBE9222339.1 monofunctional biosynthetic peptidoglycan transglycosylase [Cyanobacterium stanieri LEGE 03274]
MRKNKSKRAIFLYIFDWVIKNIARLYILILILSLLYLSTNDVNIQKLPLIIIFSLLILKTFALFSLNWVNPPTSAFMLRVTNSFSDKSKKRIQYTWIKYDDISPFMPIVVILSEDYQFPNHSGFNWREILRAFQLNRSSHSLIGGSSISQQTVKNLFLYPSKTLFRKTMEAYLTLILEAVLSKKRILEIYLNIVQFSPDIFGVESASLHFFKKSAQSLTVEESCLLATVMPNPYIYEVHSPSHYMRERQELILSYLNKAISEQSLEHFLSSSHFSCVEEKWFARKIF